MEEKKDEGSHEHKEHHEHKVHHEHKEKMKIKKVHMWMIASGVLAVLLIISIATGGFKGKSASGSNDGFIFLNSDACTTACDQIEPAAKELVEQSGLSYSKLKYFQPVEVPGYVLIKDGVVSLNGIQDESTLAQVLCDATGKDSVCSKATVAQQQAQVEASKSAEEQCAQMPKVDKPKLEVFYVSRCPFGVQAINSLYYVAKNFGNEVEVIPRLLVDKTADGKATTSMHGAEEHVEDLRQICLQKEQYPVYWDYINCYAESGDSTACEKTAKVDSDKLAKCDGEKYALKEADDWAKIYKPKGGSGSPSFFLNGEKINEYDFSANGRSPDNVRNIICCSMKTEGAGCGTQLSTAQPPRGFGKMDANAAATTASDQLNCG